MFSKSFFVSLLALALSVQAIPHQQQQQHEPECNTVSTVVRTVTVTARGSTATHSSSNNNNGGNGKGNTGGNNNNNNNNNGGNSKGNNGGKNNNNNNGNNGKDNNGKGTSSAAGSKSTSTAAAASSSAAANNGGGKGGDPQTSTTLDPRVIASGFANDGQDVPEAGQVPSLTSTNNFINFCLTAPNLPLTDGKQITTGSCNPAPIGLIPSVDNMPSSKFTFPTNFGTVKAGETFTIEMAIQNMQTGFFVNAQENYFSAPQQLNAQGQIQGHSHVVVELISSLESTTPSDPKKFAFFKGLNAAAVGGKLTAVVTDGLAAGVYKLSSINTAANHQPVIVPIAQHGSLDDAIYFTVTADGKPVAAPGSGGKNGAATAPASATSVASSAKGAATSAVSSKAGSNVAATAPGRGAAVSSASPASNTPASTKNNGNNNGNNNNNNNKAGSNTNKNVEANNNDKNAEVNTNKGAPTAQNNSGNKVPSGPVSSAHEASSPANVRGGGRRRALNRQA